MPTRSTINVDRSTLELERFVTAELMPLMSPEALRWFRRTWDRISLSPAARAQAIMAAALALDPSHLEGLGAAMGPAPAAGTVGWLRERVTTNECSSCNRAMPSICPRCMVASATMQHERTEQTNQGLSAYRQRLPETLTAEQVRAMLDRIEAQVNGTARPGERHPWVVPTGADCPNCSWHDRWACGDEHCERCAAVMEEHLTYDCIAGMRDCPGCGTSIVRDGVFYCDGCGYEYCEYCGCECD